MSKTPDVLDATLAGFVIPLRKHLRAKDQSPYWTFDAFGEEEGWRAAKFGVSGDPLDDVVPSEINVYGTVIPLRQETATVYKGKVKQYHDRRVGEGEITVPGAGVRPVAVSISQRHENGHWNVRIVVQNRKANGRVHSWATKLQKAS